MEPIVVEGNTQNPKHLVILVHGLHGSSTDLISIKEVLHGIKDKENDEILAHGATCNEGLIITHQGVDAGGKRLADEIQTIVKNYPSLTKFSIIGHSLGGLFARYCIGVLYQAKFFDRIKPVNFITFATPHMGSRRSPRWWTNGVTNMFVRTMLSTTGKHLMLEDVEGEKIPLLLAMSRPESEYFIALAAFETRILYANVQNDMQVPYSTAAIMPNNPMKEKISTWKAKDAHPHILEDDAAGELNTAAKEFYAYDAKAKELREMLKNLQSLQWMRVNVRLDSLFSHEMIVAKRKWMTPNIAQDIVNHLAKFF